MKKRNYNIGLDIGTSSIGWTIVDDNAQIMRAKGKNGYGVRIFAEGKTAADRRGFRTTRRRLKRRKWRLRLLQEFFEPYILPIDENFFMRQKESNLVPQDPNKHFKGSILFNDRTDQEFHEQYPTIYHLRYALMTEHRQFDVREIYWAIHHIVKYRGHFLNSTLASKFKGGELRLADKFESLNKLFLRVQAETGFELSEDNVDKIKTVLLDNGKSRLDRQREVLKIVYLTSEDKDTEKKRKAVATEFIKAVLGLKTKLFIVLAKNPTAETDWKFSFDAEDIDDKLDSISEQLTDDDHEIVELISEIHSIITLTGVVPEGMGLSESMIAKYDQHQLDLKKLKSLMRDLDVKQARKLQDAYDEYIDGLKPSEEAFYSAVSSVIQKMDDPRAKKITAEIELEEFMPKQRTKANGQIPHQLHQQELDQIIENQKEYYPWLAEENPNKREHNAAPHKLDGLVTFRVPYYVGPLIEASVQQKTSNSNFAWMERKVKNDTSRITPWNFEEKVDRNASAENFIKRMTTKDTYLLNEDVLPQQSLLYQRYEVLNELNNVRVNDKKLENNCKQDVYKDLFKNNTTVSIKKFKDYLVANCEYADNPKIEGLADESIFLSSLSTENKFKDIFGAQIDDPNYFEDFEHIIEWATIFEDNKILRAKLDEISWLNESQKKELAKLRMRGWGRLSRKLIAEITDENGSRIIDLLWEHMDNFMVVVNQDVFKEKIVAENKQVFKELNPLDIINEQFTSPQNKKALRQILLVVADIQKAMNGVTPSNIFIEFAREDERNPRRSIQRLRQVENMYRDISDTVLADPEVRNELSNIKNTELTRDRVFLYFLQGGRDVYTGEPLNIDKLSEYDIDHILPQAFIKDNSLDNRVLVSASLNRSKSDSVPLDDFTSEMFGRKMEPLWEQMQRAGLISKKKLANLKFNPENINKYTRNGFINRQLVETRQVIKLAANILKDHYGEETGIVNVKAGLTHQFRKDFDFPKNRNVNNYHHAFDAYLTALVGTYLLKKYPKLESYFVYGKFKKGDGITNLKNFNFLHGFNKPGKIINKKTGEILFDRDKQLGYMNSIYDLRKVIVTHELSTRHGAMYDQTLYKASDDKDSGRGGKQLIRKKDNLPTEIYGGYTGSTDAFMSIIRMKKKDKLYYKVIGVPTRVAHEVLQSDGKINIFTLNKFIEQKLTKEKVNKKTGAITRITDWFELVIAKVMYGQVIDDGGQPFMLGSSTLPYNVRELYLAKDLVKVINKGSTSKSSYLDVYDELVKSLNKYFPMYDRNMFRQKITDARDKFEKLPKRDEVSNGKLQQIGQVTIIDRILIGLHTNAGVSNLKDLGIATPFGFMQQGNGISLTSTAKIIYQSSTGLFEKSKALDDLNPLA